MSVVFGVMTGSVNLKAFGVLAIAPPVIILKTKGRWQKAAAPAVGRWEPQSGNLHRTHRPNTLPLSVRLHSTFIGVRKFGPQEECRAAGCAGASLVDRDGLPATTAQNTQAVFGYASMRRSM